MRQWQGMGREGDGRPMRLYNTATCTVEELTVRDNTVSMYVCGVTPYDTTHTGHAFTYVTFDTLARHLAHKGHEVHYVQNVTDIDDDILRRAAEVGVPWDVLGREQTAIYLRDPHDDQDGPRAARARRSLRAQWLGLLPRGPRSRLRPAPH